MGSCHYLEGNIKAQDRAEGIELMLEDFGLEPERFRIEWLSSSEAQKFADVMTEMTQQLRDIGPSPYNTRV
ncbi:MAG: hydrogenase iron-sulfur subunit [Proteobacteria bacterium]|nr:hydrogenase iron-sulfur subunit [Pseudomonadota bacterium]